MTCIVGLEYNGVVYMGADSCATGQGENHISLLMSEPKIFHIGPYLIGSCGSFRLADILRVWFSSPIATGGEPLSPYGHMVKYFVPALRKALSDQGWLASKDGRDVGGTILVGYGGKLFEVQTSFAVTRSLEGYAAVGTGTMLALGSLYTSSLLNTDGLVTLTPEERLNMALQAADRFCYSVRAPFTILSTNKD